MLYPQNDIKQQRWLMLTNPQGEKLDPMANYYETEIIEHVFFIDLTCDGPRLTDGQMAQCRERFRRFCEDQWDNRTPQSAYVDEDGDLSY